MIRTRSKLQNLVEMKMKARKTVSYTSKMTSNPHLEVLLKSTHTPVRSKDCIHAVHGCSLKQRVLFSRYLADICKAATNHRVNI